MKDIGWIKLHRALLDWEWYSCANTKAVFLHLLLTANFEKKRWRGIEVNEGQTITGTIELSETLGLGRQVVRACLDRLKSTSEITIKTTNKYSIITITKWHDYQLEQPANQPTTNQQPTNNQPHLKNDKKERREEEDKYIRSKPDDLFFENQFNEFWELYPKRQGRGQAERAYATALKKADHQTIIEGAKRYVEHHLKLATATQYIKQPATWLNGQCWADELAESAPHKQASHAQQPKARGTAYELAIKDFLENGGKEKGRMGEY